MSCSNALAWHPVENIVLENVKITCKGGGAAEQAKLEVPYSKEYSPLHLGIRPAYGFYIRHVTGLKFHNVSVAFEKPDLRPALNLYVLKTFFSIISLF